MCIPRLSLAFEELPLKWKTRGSVRSTFPEKLQLNSHDKQYWKWRCASVELDAFDSSFVFWTDLFISNRQTETYGAASRNKWCLQTLHSGHSAPGCIKCISGILSSQLLFNCNALYKQLNTKYWLCKVQCYCMPPLHTDLDGVLQIWRFLLSTLLKHIVAKVYSPEGVVWQTPTKDKRVCKLRKRGLWIVTETDTGSQCSWLQTDLDQLVGFTKLSVYLYSSKESWHKGWTRVKGELSVTRHRAASSPLIHPNAASPCF